MGTMNGGNDGKEVQWLPTHNAMRIMSVVKGEDLVATVVQI